jgi:hypothetical protein
MKTQTRLAVIAVACAGALAAVFGGYQRLHSPSYTVPPPTRSIELMGPNDREWLEMHYPAASGKDRVTRVRYKNDDQGIRVRRNDGTVEIERIWNARGDQRMSATFAPDGLQVVSGFRLRDNGTALWFAVPDDRRLVYTSTYWWNGRSTFSLQKRRISSPNVDEMYYHSNGKPWMHYVGNVGRDVAPSTAEVWNEDGVLVFTHYSGLNGTTTDTGYRADGTMAYRQYWTTREGSVAVGEKPETRKVLLKAEIYGTNGQLSREFMMADDGYIVNRVVEHDEKGRRFDLSVRYDGTVVSVTEYDDSGKQISQAYTKRGEEARKVLLDSAFREVHVGEFDPRGTWQQAEDEHAAS